MKIILKGNVFNPTGIATANREIMKALSKEKEVKVQTNDIWHDAYEFNKGLEKFNQPINAHGKEVFTIFADYPQYWQQGHGKIIAHFLHEGTKIFPEWVQKMNTIPKIFVPSQATKNLFKWNDVRSKIKVIPYGVKEMYKPIEREPNKDFVFLSVNSWTGQPGDRKGTDILIKAFDEEFRNEDNVRLLLKISTFFQAPLPYYELIKQILGHENEKILINDKYLPEEELVEHYQKSDCFVSPTRGESFGLTIANAMATGLPTIVTKDINSGHMDFCKDFSYWIEAPTVSQGDQRFYVEGNMLADPDIKSLKEQMRYVFEHQEEAKKRGLEGSKWIKKNLTWKHTAKEIIKFMKEEEDDRL